jgi:hypothetical protein
MLWRVRERSRSSSPSQLWVAGPLSPYNVIIYLFCIELLLYSKDVTFDPVPWFIICVRLGPSTPGDYVRARVLVPRNPGVTPKGSTFDLIGYSDADWAGCKIDRKSTSGTCQFLGRSLMSWASKKQNSEALSTAEVEYIAAGHCCTQLLWMMPTLGTMATNWAKSLSYVIMRVQSAWQIIPLNTAALST